MARKGGKRTGAGRPVGSNNALNRDLLKVITEKEIKDLIKVAYTSAFNGNNRLQEYFMDQFVGRAPVEQQDGNVSINIFELLKGKK